MIAYIIDKTDLRVKDFLYFKDYSFAEDIEYTNKSKIVIPRLAEVADDDFVICKDDKNTVQFFGIASDTDTSDSTDNFGITMKQKECLFDRFIFAQSESLLATSVEAFVANAITNNWISSGDALMDRAYISPVIVTNTPVAASLGGIVNLEDGVYNLKTFLGNIRERYGIFVDFELTDTNPAIVTGPRLTIRIYKDTAGAVPIDTDVSDITDVQETYSVDVLAKLMVKWLNTTTNVTTYRTFYLLANRSTTEDAMDTNRVDGIIKATYIEAETEAEMLDEVVNEFQSNRYSHKVTFLLREGSELYLPDDYYVGRQCTLETKTGVRTSIITAIERNSGSGVRRITMGKLRVTLTEKLRSST